MISQDIFMKKNALNESNDIIHLSLTETEQHQHGGALNDIIHLSLTSDNFTNNNVFQNGGSVDSDEYFNRLAEKIVNSSKLMNGGFNVVPNIDESSEIFLSTETINFINNDAQLSGGVRKNVKSDIKSNDKLQFNFNDLKKHLMNVSNEHHLYGGSDIDEESENDDSDDFLFDDDTDDEDDKEEKEIAKLFEDSISSDKNDIPMHSHRAKTINKKQHRSTNLDDSDESDLEIDLDGESDEESDENSDDELELDSDIMKTESETKTKNLKNNKTNDSESLGSSTFNSQYEFSESISSPKLISYRKIDNKSTNKNIKRY